jgi:hypothetical protein
MPATDPRQVIMEILRNAPNGINRTKLYKSFYLAHLVYTDTAPGILTNWPIVHMPQGPGISDSWKLLDDLAESGYLSREFSDDGLYRECIYRATVYVLPKTATEISRITHEDSRSWIEGVSGQELEIYTDLIDDDEYSRRDAQLSSLESQLDAALKDMRQ